MNKKILTLMILSFLIPAGLLLLSTNVNGADTSGIIEPPELESEMDFPEFEELRDGYWWNDWGDYTFHQNGKVYLFTDPEGYVTVPTIGLVYGDIIDVEDEFYLKNYDLGLERDDSWNYDDYVIGTDDDGELIAFVYWEGDDYGSYKGAFLRFTINQTGIPELVSVSTVDFNILYRIDNMALHELGDEMAVTFEDEFSGVHILHSSGNDLSIDLGTWNIWSVCTFDGDIILYWLDTDGSMKLTKVAGNMTILDEKTIDSLEAGEGFDMVMEMMAFDDHFDLVTYFDETFETVYDRLEVTRIDRDLEIVNKEHLEFPDDMIVSTHHPLIQYDQNIGFISGNLYRIYFYDTETYQISYEGLFEQYDLINGYDISEFEMDAITETDILIEELRGLPVIIAHDYDDFGTMLTRSDVIPEFGSLVIKGNCDITAGSYVVNRDITILDNMTIVGSELEFTDDIDMYVEGKVIIEDSSMTWDRRDDEGNIHVTGTIEIRDSYIENGLYLNDPEANVEIHGNPFPLEDSDGHWVYMYQGHVKIFDMEIKDYSGQRYAPDELFRLASGTYEPELEFFNCSFIECKPFIYYNSGNVNFYNTRMDGIDGYSSSKFHFTTLDGCEISNSTGLTGSEGFVVRDCNFRDDISLYIWEDGSFIDSTFRDIITPFEEIENCEVTFSGCEFNNCPNAIVATYSYLEILDCDFHKTPMPITLKEMGSFNISGCEFHDFHTAITIDEEVLDDETMSEFIITENTFGEGNETILIEDLYYKYRYFVRGDVWDHYYGEDDKEYKRFELRFLDARNNKFQDRDIEEVAESLSPMIYFLPYYDTNGNQISTDDNDMDGMKDDWERDNGFDPTSILDRYMDADLDRYTNYEEYREGTDPHDEDSNPGQRVRIRILIFQIILIFIPIMILVCYLYYFQIAFASEKRKKFMKKYWRYKAQRDINKKLTSEHEEKMHPSNAHSPVFKVKADELPPEPSKPPKQANAEMKKQDGGDEE